MSETARPEDTFRELAQASAGQLDALIGGREGPDPMNLAGQEFRGLNIVPGARILGIRKFIKGFFRDAATGNIEGYNVRVEQNDDASDWVRNGGPFGYFTVENAGPASRYPAAVLLDYGASARNFHWRTERLLRDYLVVPDPAEPDVLLGKAYLALGAGALKVGWFVLERIP